MLQLKNRTAPRKAQKNAPDPEKAAWQEAMAGLTGRMEKLAAGELETGAPVAPAAALLPQAAALFARADKAGQTVAATLRRLTEIAAAAEKEAPAGNFANPADPKEFAGCYAAIVTSLNQAFAGLVGPLRGIGRQIRQISDGEAPAEDPTEYRGEFAALQQRVQALREEKNRSVTGIAAAAGTLDEETEGMADFAQAVAQAAADSQQQITAAAASSHTISAGMTQAAATLASSTADITGIASSVEEMSGTIRNLAAASEQTSASVSEVSRLVGDIFGNIRNVSDSTDQVNSRVDATVRSIKEISQSLDEVGGHCEKAHQIATRAKETAGVTGGIIGKLDESSRQIGKVVGLINDIASQTNILALNAAIEAASAGDAGRGFAVVANEVKELAKQTAEATGDIRQQIETMLQNTADAVKAVADINQVVDNLADISGTIASAVTEQTAAAAGISTSATEAAGELSHINDRIGTVAKETKDVSHSTEESAKGVEDIARSATELSGAAAEAAKRSETASHSVLEVNQAMSGMLEEVVRISELMHQTRDMAEKNQQNAGKVKEHSAAICELSQNLSRTMRQETRHE